MRLLLDRALTKALEDGKDIDYTGASGPIDMEMTYYDGFNGTTPIAAVGTWPETASARTTTLARAPKSGRCGQRRRALVPRVPESQEDTRLVLHFRSRPHGPGVLVEERHRVPERRIREGDRILIMGARDDTLIEFARELVERLQPSSRGA